MMADRLAFAPLPSDVSAVQDQIRPYMRSPHAATRLISKGCVIFRIDPGLQAVWRDADNFSVATDGRPSEEAPMSVSRLKSPVSDGTMVDPSLWILRRT